jgi:hypothetical protein
MAAAALAVLLTLPLRREVLPLSELKFPNYLNVGLGIIGILAYLMAIGLLGFVTSSALFIIVATWLSGYRRPMVILATAILVPFTLRLVFRFGLHVGLPTGALY